MDAAKICVTGKVIKRPVMCPDGTAKYTIAIDNICDDAASVVPYICIIPKEKAMSVPGYIHHGDIVNVEGSLCVQTRKIQNRTILTLKIMVNEHRKISGCLPAFIA